MCRLCQGKLNARQYDQNRHRRIAQVQSYVMNNRDKYNAYRRDLQKRKMADPVYRMSRIVRCRMSHVLKGRQKTGKSVDYLGCSFDDLKLHLEWQFQPGMTWENYGEAWQVDHKIPLATLSVNASDADVRRLSHYTNLRPLWAEENMSLGGRLRHRPKTV